MMIIVGMTCEDLPNIYNFQILNETLFFRSFRETCVTMGAPVIIHALRSNSTLIVSDACLLLVGRPLNNCFDQSS